MKNSYTVLMLFLIITPFAACGPTISGKDEKAFKSSKAKMEEKLDKEERENLEKALRIIVVKAMKEKWNSPEKYEGKSFDKISMEIIDGKSYSAIISYAEDFLKADRDEKIANKTAEIDSLEKDKLKAVKITQQIDAFKLTKISISEDVFFSDDPKQPFLDLTFTNTFKENLIGEYMLYINIYSKKTGELIASEGQGGTWNDDYVLKPNENFDYHQPLLHNAVQHSNLWKTAKYPITDFSPYDLVIKAYATKITTKKGGTIERPKADVTYFDAEIKKLNEEIKALKVTKATLDELELTDKM
ncbi:hypothetical protein ASE92_06040 [Pedobacter sp. Leaf41]|uniref:hypothetical protein n=1 Tax=Pedobacter sp. Leaf41 TaxID=1736218 RepID=UPI0007026BBD|nr:hypothetical protein [Pedobacter sp. Leaf41]KQN38972.1 hypothetical protein ASE92_06040 [Pedobacter sp. Leaf41]